MSKTLKHTLHCLKEQLNQIMLNSSGLRLDQEKLKMQSNCYKKHYTILKINDILRTDCRVIDVNTDRRNIALKENI